MFSGAITKRQKDMFDYCQTLGEVYTGFVDGEFVCCWGLIPPSFLSNQAYLWMWGPEPLPHQFVFIRQSQLQVQRMLSKYEEVIGDCLVKNRSAQKWLKWLGAEFGPPNNGALPFVIRREKWAQVH
jgi:hypothetical protein